MSTSHILPLPTAFLALRAVQLAVAVTILGLSAYVVTFIAFDGACLSLFTAIVTMIIAVYNIVSSTGLKAAYNYWAMLALDIFAIIFWIISFSYLAWQTAAATVWYTSYSSYDCTYSYYYCYKKRDLPIVSRATTDVYTYRNSMAAAAGLGGLEFILFVITLIFTAIHIVRHRKAGGHCTPARAGTAPAPAPAPTQAPVGGPAPVYSTEKQNVEANQNAQPQYVQQPVQYVQHPSQPAPQQPQQPYPVYAAQPNQQVQSA